jgi:hypothetical protein
MSKRPVGDAIEAYVSARFGITEPTVVYAMDEKSDYGESGRVDWTVFTIEIYGTKPDGESFFDTFEDGQAAEFLDAMEAWDGS